MESKWEAVVCANQTVRLGNLAAITDRFPGPEVSRTGLIHNVNVDTALPVFTTLANKELFQY
jgi:hypothetical protein